MKQESPVWLTYKKGEKIVDQVEKRRGFLDKPKGHDSEDLMDEEAYEDKQEKAGAWENPKMDKDARGELEEKLLNHGSHQKVLISQEQENLSKLENEFESISNNYPNEYAEFINMFPYKQKEHNELVKEHASCITKLNELIADSNNMMDVIEEKIPWDKLFKRDEVVKNINADPKIHEQFEGSKKISAIIKKWSFGMLNPHWEEVVLKHAALEMARKKIEENTRAHDQIKQRILQINQEGQDIVEWRDQRYASASGPILKRLNDLNGELADAAKRLHNFENPGLVN